MMKNYWQTQLTAFDAELCKMVESLTGKPCEPKNGGDHFFFEADYEKHNDPQYILAIWDAIEGRTGKRLISINDDADRHALFVRVKFSEQKYPGVIRLNKETTGNPAAGNPYYPKTDDFNETLAIQVEIENADALFEFVGNGEWEIPDDAPATFNFLNAAGSVYAHAPEHSYIVYIGPERFEIVDKETFEKEYELR